ncbi:MAG: transmembrane 220 family protein [Bacteroidota bacterium]
MKVVNAILTVLFIVFALVQLNDPDPLVWVIVYGFVAGVSAFAFMGKYNKIVLGVGMAVTLIWAITLSPGVYDWFANHQADEIFESMAPNKIFIETARECFGLIIAFLVFLFHFFQAKKQEQAVA